MSRVSSPTGVWTWLIALLSIHIATNRAAVRAVSLRTLNRQRANIVFSTLFSDDVALSPTQVSRQERIFERDGVLRWKGSDVLGFAYIGVELRELLTVASRRSSTGALRSPKVNLALLAQLYAGEAYLLWYDAGRRRVLIALKESATKVDQLKAWAHGLLAAREFVQSGVVTSDEVSILTKLGETLREINVHFDRHILRLIEAGWHVEAAALETRSGSRIVVRVE